MKALQLTALHQVDLVDRPIPEIKADQLLISTGAATICTSDILDIGGNPFNMKLPNIFGHEGAGTVAAVGTAVAGFKPGDRVSTHPVHPCYACDTCQEGLGHLCPNMGHFGYDLPGVFAEYYLVRQDRARLLPEGVDFAVAALVEPVSVCLEALAQARLAAGSRLLIIGDGPFGVLMARLAARMNLAQVVIAGYFDFRLEQALGATPVNTANLPDPVLAMRNATDGQAYDAAILAVSSRRAFADGLRCLKPRGRMVVFSALTGNTPVDLFRVHMRELEVIGACSDQDKFDAAHALLADSELRLSDLITHRYPLQEYQQALQMAEFGKDQALKVAFVF